ncbi:hypothetical protein AQUCO_04700114v1 [Aquilegia coerulea]|uniref:Uncharacterized protein n=1 Tax=Aquilegia coerulea TaxID=218851 RepID=A0A2G5CL70_AQUCA|nr:hypothetical protein AQUCO_04700114v1 [Aquilegia coerulea]
MASINFNWFGENWFNKPHQNPITPLNFISLTQIHFPKHSSNTPNFASIIGLEKIGLIKPLTKQPLLQSSATSIDYKQSRSEPEPEPAPESDLISLRPLGRTGSSSLTSPSPPPSSSSSTSTTTTCTSPPLITLLPPQEPVISLKPQPFVPPHLRPGFVRKEEKVFGQRNQGLRSRDIGYGQLQNDGQNGRPKSGGGYERIQRGGESDLEVMNRPSSSGNRPNSSGGWYASSSNSSSYRSRWRKKN